MSPESSCVYYLDHPSICVQCLVHVCALVEWEFHVKECSMDNLLGTITIIKDHHFKINC